MKLKALTLIPGKGGCFEVRADGQLLWSKLSEGTFPDDEMIAKQVGKALG